jgi:hypothetical protein
MYDLYLQAQRAGVSAATMAINAHMIEKMMILSNFEGFFNVAPKESIMDVEGAMLESSQMQFLEGVFPDGSSCILLDEKKK